MLQPVALNQHRFVVPGLRADARGVAVAPLLIILVPTLEAVLRVLSGISRQTTFDDLGELVVGRVVTATGTREFAIELAVSDSYGADLCAQVARLARGLCFTGARKHFVRYRDTRAPLGYDVESLEGGEADYVLYDTTFVQSYRLKERLALGPLVLSLELRPEPQARAAPSDGPFALLAARGLWPELVSYLLRHEISAEAMTLEGEQQQPIVVRLERLPRRMVRLFSSMPGVTLFTLVRPNVAVEFGHVHPIDPVACGKLYLADDFYLLRARRQPPLIVRGAATFIDLEALRDPRAAGLEAVSHPGAALTTFRLELEVVRDAASSNSALLGRRLPYDQLGRLRALFKLLPTPLLRRLRLAANDRDLYLVGDDDVALEAVPLGELYRCVDPRLWLPAGYSLRPALDTPRVLRAIGHEPGTMCFYCPRRSRFVVLPDGAFIHVHELELSVLPLVEEATRDLADPAPEPRLLQYSELGFFPLWGMRLRSKDAADG